MKKNSIKILIMGSSSDFGLNLIKRGLIKNCHLGLHCYKGKKKIA